MDQFALSLDGAGTVAVTEHIYPAAGIVRYSVGGHRIGGTFELRPNITTGGIHPDELCVQFGAGDAYRSAAKIDLPHLFGVTLCGTTHLDLARLDAGKPWTADPHRVINGKARGKAPARTAQVAEALVRPLVARWLTLPQRSGLLAAHARTVAPGLLADLRHYDLAEAIRNRAKAQVTLEDLRVHEAHLANLAGEPAVDLDQLTVYVLRRWDRDDDIVEIYGSPALAARALAEWARAHWDRLPQQLHLHVPNRDDAVVDLYYEHIGDEEGHLIYPAAVPGGIGHIPAAPA